MKISLIYVEDVEGSNPAPPLGLLYIGAVAREAGHDVQFIDIDPDEIDVLSKVRAFSPDLVGLSFLTTGFEKARLLSHKLKAAFPGLILCCGGVHTTVDTESVLRNFNVDFCIVGEGEATFVEVYKRIEAGQSYEDVKGVWLLKDGQLIKNPSRELIKDLDSIPFPPYDLINFSNIYLTLPGLIKDKHAYSATIMAGRGCCFNCSFCSVNKMFGHSYRLRSCDNVLKEIVHLQKTYGVKAFFFSDSTFTTNKKWLMSFCEEIIRRGIKFVWDCNSRVDTIDMEMLQIMRRAGCAQIDYGVESGSPKILKILNKGISTERAIYTVRMTQAAGIRVGVTFMIGNPDEEIKDLKMTFNLAKKLSADNTIFFFSIPYPGTKLWEIARERNLLPENVVYGSRWNMRAAEFPLMCENISKDRLQFYRAKFQNHFFIRNYFKLDYVIVGLQFLWIMLKNPIVAWKGIKRVLKSKRWDSLIQEVLDAHRRSLYKYC